MKENKIQWGMTIDLDLCVGCQACTLACKQENNVSFVSQEQAKMGRAIEWNQVIHSVSGEIPHLKTRFLPRLCNHCEHPLCTKVCPVGATYKNPEGLVAQIYTRCIGCRFCTVACPYTARYFNWYPPKWPEEMKKSLNPAVYVREKGVVEKCTFCSQRIREARYKAKDEGRELRDGDVIPACVETCPTKARIFGNMADPNSKVSELSRSPRAFKLMENLGTEPKVIYLTERAWNESR
jgi:molybdopterin-containing oxidoreductase family iron-sulfur binding subunit